MRATAALLAALAAALAACATLPTAPILSVALSNPGIEDGPRQGRCAAGWNCSMHADPNSFRFFVDEGSAAGGRRSLCIEPVGREPWGKASQGVVDPAIRGRRVRFSAALRTTGVAGHGAGVQAVAHGTAGEIMVVKDTWIAGTRPWERLSVEVDVPPNTHDLEVGVALEGTGRACLDDARLEILR